LTREFKPDLVITDLDLAKLSGSSLIKTIREDEAVSSVPVIVLTSQTDLETKVNAHDMGANSFIAKPFEESELAGVVANLLKLKASEQKVRKLNNYLSENVLKKMLPSQVVDDIISGHTEFNLTSKLVPITILMSDLSNFNMNAGDLGPRKMLRVLNGYLTEMSRVITSFDGTIDKFVGDNITVLFGAPNEMAETLQVKNANACAHAMRIALDELNAKWTNEGIPVLKMRIGINHGPAVVGYLGSEERIDYTAVGQSVSMAAGVKDAAADGEIMISEVIRDMLSEDAWIRAGEFELQKGKPSVVLYKLLQENKKKAA
jgi:adenylate cyclase